MTDDEFNLTKEKLTQILNENIAKRTTRTKGVYDNDPNTLIQRMNIELESNTAFNIIKNKLMNGYGEILDNINSSNLTSASVQWTEGVQDKYVNIYKVLSEGGLEYILEVRQSINTKGNLVNDVLIYHSSCQEMEEKDGLSNKVGSSTNLSIKNVGIKFRDISTSEFTGELPYSEVIPTFNREYENYKIMYINGKENNIELNYNFPDMFVESLDLERDDNIGALDLETYGEDGNGRGSQIVFAGG